MADTQFILVVEDDPVLKNLLGHTLAGKYQTLYASNGNEALTLFNENHPVLVLLDLMLPDLDGFAVLTDIRTRSDEYKDTPIIVVSNLGAEADVTRAKGLGANDYLIKAEVTVEEIVERMQKLLDTPEEAAPAPVA